MRRILGFFPYLLFFSLSIIPFLWLNGKNIILGYDAVFPLSPLPFLINRIFSWSPDVNFGIDQAGFQGSLIVHFIDSIPSFFGAGTQLSEQLVFSFWFFLILFSAFFLGWKLEKEKIIQNPYFKFIFAVLYAFNFYILQAWWIIERTKFSLVVATPIILALFIPLILRLKATRREILTHAFLASLVLTIFNGGGWIGLPLYGGLLVSLFSFYIFFLIVNYLQGKKNQNLNLTLLFFSFFSFFFLLNAYTLLPFILVTFREYGAQLQGAGGISGLVEWSRYISENTSVLNLLRLQGIPDWYNNGLAHPYSNFYLNNPILIFGSFLFPFFLLLSTQMGKTKNLVVSFFTFLLIISLFFTAGSHKPLNFVFEFMIKYLPGFAIFRSPFFKFGYSFWLAASFLIAYSLSLFIIFLTRKPNFNKRFLGYLILVLLIVLILLYHFPYFKGDFFRTSTTRFGSKVAIPSYVYEFNSWWLRNENNNRVLLLPKLNSNWLFEQYDWKYLSLFPLLQNFAAKGIVENTDNLSSQERALVDNLYSSINEGNYETMDKLAGVLGIKYFLMRNDFDFNALDQETDNPSKVEEKLQKNNNLKLVKSFGRWNLYSYDKDNPLFYTQNFATVSNEFQNGLDVSRSKIFLDQADGEKNPSSILENVIIPECISCNAEIVDISVQIPEPKILLDSPLYEILNLKPLIIHKPEDTFALLGDSLKMEGQVIQIILQEKDQSLIDFASNEYIKILNGISKRATEFGPETPDAYVNSIKSQQYLTEEYTNLSDLLSKVNSENIRLNLEKDLYALSNAKNNFAKFYSEGDFNVKKFFKLHLSKAGEYDVKIPTNTLGNIDQTNLISVTLNYGGREIKPSMEGNFLSFGKISLPQGDSFFSLYLPPQKNILSAPLKQNIAGNVCFSSYIDNFSLDNTYLLKFNWKNNFDSNFLYFIDAGKKFVPISLEHLPLSGEQIKEKRIIVSGFMPFPKDANRMRVALCSPSLTEDIYNQNIKGLSAVLLTNPVIYISNYENKAIKGPDIRFTRISPIQYKVDILESNKPFYLLFAERYSSGWSSDLGDHMMANNFENAWYIQKTGSYSLNIKYEPQKYFNYGLAISLLSFFTIIYFLRRKN